MATVDWIEAPTDIHGANDAKVSSANGGSRCSGGPARKPTLRGARGCADEQQQLGAVTRRRLRRRGHARRTGRSLTRYTSGGQQGVAPTTRWIARIIFELENIDVQHITLTRQMMLYIVKNSNLQNLIDLMTNQILKGFNSIIRGRYLSTILFILIRGRYLLAFLFILRRSNIVDSVHSLELDASEDDNVGITVEDIKEEELASVDEMKEVQLGSQFTEGLITHSMDRDWSPVWTSLPTWSARKLRYRACEVK
ncbi:hypothetical protein Scep_012535 [Stephania cephalantha]|uniref:Uncharacterized protein n=1 Tax=Stephania cephalantha TaxID=152367 RepID=A0AAP0JHH6_9MAGN